MVGAGKADIGLTHPSFGTAVLACLARMHFKKYQVNSSFHAVTSSYLVSGFTSPSSISAVLILLTKDLLLSIFLFER